MSTAKPHCCKDTRESLRGISAVCTASTRRIDAQRPRLVPRRRLEGVVIVVIARALQPRANFVAQLMLCLERTLRLRSRHDALMVLARADNALRAKVSEMVRSIKDHFAKLPQSAKWAAGGACVGYVAAYVALARRPKHDVGRASRRTSWPTATFTKKVLAAPDHRPQWRVRDVAARREDALRRVWCFDRSLRRAPPVGRWRHRRAVLVALPAPNQSF